MSLVLKMTRRFLTRDWKVQVQTIAGDGNCLYSSKCHQLCVLSEAHSVAIKSLREWVVAFLWHNKYQTKVYNAVTTRIAEEWPDLTSETDGLQ